MNREQELTKLGWTKRNIMDEPRLSEIVETYKELGMEVLLEPVDLDSEDWKAPRLLTKLRPQT